MQDLAPITLLDRAIAWLAPSAGLRRVQARAGYALATRAYEAARQTRLTKGWRATGASANAETGPALTMLRNRSRDLERNNTVVASAIHQFAGRIVGTGITPRAVHPNKHVRKRAMEAWDEFIETCDPEGLQDFYGKQHLAVRTMFRDGDLVQLWLPDDAGPDGQIRLLEGDHLDTTRLKMTGNEGRIVQGIEFDDWGRRRGYWLYPMHPGENAVGQIRGESKFVRAAEVDHLFHVLRPGQARGVPWLAPAMLRLRGLDDIDESMIVRKRLEACIGLVLQTADAQGPMPVAGEQQKNGARIEETIRPGMILRAGPGEGVESFIPSSSGDIVEFTRSQLYAVCAITGTPYHAVTGDVGGANYSSLRAAQLAGHVLLDVVQWLVVIPRICKPAWRRQMRRLAMKTGNAAYLNVKAEWSPPARPWVDPVKEIAAKIAEIRAGLQSMPDALAERGLDWPTQLDEIETFLKAVDEKKLAFDTDPRRLNGSGALHQLAMQPEPAPHPATD